MVHTSNPGNDLFLMGLLISHPSDDPTDVLVQIEV